MNVYLGRFFSLLAKTIKFNGLYFKHIFIDCYLFWQICKNAIGFGKPAIKMLWQLIIYYGKQARGNLYKTFSIRICTLRFLILHKY